MPIWLLFYACVLLAATLSGAAVAVRRFRLIASLRVSRRK